MRRRMAIGLTVGAGMAGISACRRKESGGVTAAPDPPRPEGWDLVPVRVEEALEIRTIAGLRPYRPSGFVVSREDDP